LVGAAALKRSDEASLSKANIWLVRIGRHNGTPAEPEKIAEANSAAMARGEYREGRQHRKLATRNTGTGPRS
jgi:hypothetical protein